MRADGRSRFATRLFTRGTSMLLIRLACLFWTTTVPSGCLLRRAERLHNEQVSHAEVRRVSSLLGNPLMCCNSAILCRTELEGLYAPFSSCIMIGQDIECMHEPYWQAAAISVHKSVIILEIHLQEAAQETSDSLRTRRCFLQFPATRMYA